MRRAWAALCTVTGGGFALLGTALLIAYPMLVGTTARHVVWQATDRADFFVEFQSLIVFIPDLIAVPLIALAWLRRGVPRLRVGLIGGLALLLLIWAFGSAAWSPEPRIAAVMAAKLLLALGVGWAAVRLLPATDRARRTLLTGLVLAGLVQAGIAIGQNRHDDVLGGAAAALGEIYVDPGGELYRGSGLTVHPNNLAGLLIVSIGGALIVLAERPRLRVLVLAVLIGGLAATGSRAGLGGLLVIALLAGLTNRRLTRWRGTLLIGGGLIGLVAVLIVLSIPELRERLLAERNFHVRETWEVITFDPVRGAGSGSVLLHIAERYAELDLLPPVLPAHNVPLLMTAELGVIGLALLLGLIGAVLWRLRTAPRPFGLVLAAVIVISQLDYYWWGDERLRGLLAWWCGIGIGWALHPVPITAMPRSAARSGRIFRRRAETPPAPHEA